MSVCCTELLDLKFAGLPAEFLPNILSPVQVMESSSLVELFAGHTLPLKPHYVIRATVHGCRMVSAKPKVFILCCLFRILRILCMWETFCDVYIISQESRFVRVYRTTHQQNRLILRYLLLLLLFFSYFVCLLVVIVSLALSFTSFDL